MCESPSTYLSLSQHTYLVKGGGHNWASLKFDDAHFRYDALGHLKDILYRKCLPKMKYPPTPKKRNLKKMLKNENADESTISSVAPEMFVAMKLLWKCVL